MVACFRRYKTKLAIKFCQAIRNWDQVRAEGARLPDGKRGIEYGYKAHLMDTAKLVVTS